MPKAKQGVSTCENRLESTGSTGTSVTIHEIIIREVSDKLGNVNNNKL